MDVSIENQGNDELINEVVNEVDDDNEESSGSGSLAAGFAKVRGGESHTDAGDAATANANDSTGTAAASTTGSEEVTAQEGATKEPEAAPEEMFMGMPASQVKAILEKAADFEKVEQRLYGKFGEFQKKINAIQTNAASGQPLSITKEKLSRLSADFPDLAELLAEDLSAVLKSPASGFDQEQVNTLVNERLQSELQRIETDNAKKLLTMAHRDWRQVRDSTEWETWLTSQPADKQQQIRSSYDPLEIADAITEHKAWKKEAADKAAAAEAAKQRRENKLAKSVTPSGLPATGPMKLPDSQGLSAGFNRVRGRG